MKKSTCQSREIKYGALWAGISFSWSGKCSWEDGHSDQGGRENHTVVLSKWSSALPIDLFPTSPVALAMGKQEVGQRRNGHRGIGCRVASAEQGWGQQSPGADGSSTPASARTLFSFLPSLTSCPAPKDEFNLLVLCLTTDSCVPASPISFCGSLDHYPGWRGCQADQPKRDRVAAAQCSVFTPFREEARAWMRCCRVTGLA